MTLNDLLATLPRPYSSFSEEERLIVRDALMPRPTFSTEQAQILQTLFLIADDYIGSYSPVQIWDGSEYHFVLPADLLSDVTGNEWPVLANLPIAQIAPVKQGFLP